MRESSASHFALSGARVVTNIRNSSSLFGKNLNPISKFPNIINKLKLKFWQALYILWGHLLICLFLGTSYYHIIYSASTFCRLCLLSSTPTAYSLSQNTCKSVFFSFRSPTRRVWRNAYAFYKPHVSCVTLQDKYMK